jgi:ribonuclease E
MTTPSVALYILNNKRAFINDMEARHGLPITVLGSDKLAGANFTIEKGTAPSQPQRRPERGAVNMDWGFEETEGEIDGKEAAPPRERSAGPERQDDDSRGGRRRRRRRRGGRRGDHPEAHAGEDEMRPASFEITEPDDEFGEGTGEPLEAAAEPRQQQPSASGEGRRGRRRGRRGGRRGRDREARSGAEGPQGLGEQPDVRPAEPYEYDDEGAPFHAESAAPAPAIEPEPQAFETPETRPARATPPAEPAAAPSDQAAARGETKAVAADAPEPSEVKAATPRRSRVREGASEPRLERIVVGQSDAPTGEPEEDTSAPARRGWWQRRLGG